MAPKKLHLARSTWRYSKTVHDIDSMSSGSMAPHLEVWRHGCPKSLEWEGELELGSADENEEGDDAGSVDENEDEGLEDYLKQVIESPMSVLVRDFLSSADVLEMRTTGHKWNVARLFGSFAELWFFLMKKMDNDRSEPLPEWPSLKFDYRPVFGFDLGTEQWNHVVYRRKRHAQNRRKDSHNLGRPCTPNKRTRRRTARGHHANVTKVPKPSDQRKQVIIEESGDLFRKQRDMDAI